MEAGPITQQDVAAAADQLGGPANTNAAKIREILGRGSLATIQRHLQALRDAQRAPELPEAVQTIPTPPEAVSEASRGIWAAAWAMAEQRHAESLAHALDAVRRLSDDLASARADIEALAVAVEQAEERATAAENRARMAEQALHEGQTAMAAEREALDQIMVQLKALIPQVL
ncbi:hypothetical protein HAP98_12910 [Acidithiobacillus caldus]|jgi:hypothetical protein|uniref:DNA-binding protein n=1 Tax=Acidithiobacillus caldus TaxID=33059 RepID=UPI001C069FBE|nr:DNA-binding protein [Acidithiobacillus caldus]MBU2781159.1 hypothetical protein [Acidithiobacillus caldus]